MSALFSFTEAAAKPPVRERWFTALCFVAGIWYIASIATFLSATLGSGDVGYTDAQIAYLASTPTLVFIMNGLGATFGLIGAVAMFFRRDESYWVLMLSLIMVLGQLIDGIWRGGFEVMNGATDMGSIAMFLFAVLLFWVSHDARDEGRFHAGKTPTQTNTLTP